MACCSTMFSCLTCTLGPKLVECMKNCIGFRNWKLRSQIVAGASCSLFFVMMILAVTLLVSNSTCSHN